MAVYFDHNATTPVHPEVFEAMRPYLEGEFGNASCHYGLGVRAAYAIEKARRFTARLINAREEEIVFTSGGTESDNLAIGGIVLGTGKKHVITSCIEHPAVLNACRFMEDCLGCRITRLPVDSWGFVDPVDVEKAIVPETALVSIMTANNEIGSIQPISKITSICRNRSVFFHTDAVQAVGRIPIDVEGWGVDLLSLSGHKMYGPKGVGALYIREGVPFRSWMRGGSQESGRRAGTENVPGIVGLGKAAELAREEMMPRLDRVTQLRCRLWDKLTALSLGIVRNSPSRDCLPGTLNFAIPGIHAREFVRILDEEGFFVAAGSACSTGKSTPSYVLQAIGRDDTDALASLRISLGHDNSEDEIDRFVAAIPNVLKRMEA